MAARPAEVEVFVAARGNGFMRDIASWLVDAARAGGRAARLVDDRLPAADGTIALVVAPHEFYELMHATKAELTRAAASSIAVCTEQPGTPWFHLSVDACRRGLMSLDISGHGTDALREVGVNAARLRLGAVPAVSAPGATRPAHDRPIDVLFMGGLDDRRGAVLAGLAPVLARRRSELRLFRFERPATPGTPGLVFGGEKYDLLSSAKVLVNVHRDRSMHLPPGTVAPAYFEWARMLEAMANGCAVVTEPSHDHDPLVEGTHFVSAEIDDLADTLVALLDDPDRIDAIAAAAHRAVVDEGSLEHHLTPMLDRIEREVLPLLANHVSRGAHQRGLWRFGASAVPPPVRLGAFRPYLPLQSRAKRLALDEIEMLRRLDEVECLLRHGEPDVVERVETTAYADAVPEVSVVVTLYNYADVVTDTLDSVLASEDVSFEVIVVEDHATDRSRDVAREYLADHDDVPMLLLGKEVNGGLAAARNAGFEHARGGLVMVMDADNQVYPTCLRRLADALIADPGAGAAYAILEDFGTQRNIRSALAWDVERLCRANYIDAQAMLRRATWERLGGYRDDDEHVYGWEDWDLWLRLARSGGRAVLVPEILGRYRVQASSMIALTNLATDDAIAAMHRRYPDLPWPTSTR